MDISFSKELKKIVPAFKMGLIYYHDITVTVTPQLLKGRFQILLEEWLLKTEDAKVADLAGIKEWRELFKKVGTDPSRYRPSHEALIRRLKKEKALPSIHTAADVNNYFSVLYELPMGIYDLDQLQGALTIRIGRAEDAYLGIQGREMSMADKLLSSDELGPFGSPIVDSRRSMVTENTNHAVQLVYLRPSMNAEACHDALNTISKNFVQFNGGDLTYTMID